MKIRFLLKKYKYIIIYLLLNNNCFAASSVISTLSPTGVSAASYGSASEVGTFTLDVYGRITAASPEPIQIAESQVTNLTTDLANKQTLNSNLTAIAGLTSATDKGIYFTGSGTAATYDLSSFARTYLDDSNAANTRSTLGAAASGTNTDINSINLDNTGLEVNTLNAARDLIIVPQDSDNTADRSLYLLVNDADRSINLLGNLIVSDTAVVSGTNTGDQTDISGNAGTATILQTARTINGVSFNGSANINVPAVNTTTTDNALTRFDGTGGTVQNSTTATLSDDGLLNLVPTSTAGNQINMAAGISGELGLLVSNSTSGTTAYGKIKIGANGGGEIRMESLSGAFSGSRFGLSAGQAGIINSFANLYIATGTDGSSSGDTVKNLQIGTDITALTGYLDIATAGKTLKVERGSNACSGTGAVMVGGTVTVNTTCVATGDIVLITKTAAGGTSGTGVPVITIVNATSFTITGGALDTSTWSWLIIKDH